jgi:oxygen-dependent protoporphyrinogen oxidase
VEAGAEAFLTQTDGRQSAALQLASELGLPLAYPTNRPAGVAVDGTIRRLPAGTLLGIPAEADSVAEVAIITGDDPDLGRPVLAPGSDVSVGRLVRERLGDQVVQRLVDPLLGGVYAGRADDLSLAVTMPALADALTRETTLTRAVATVLVARQSAGAGPVFATVVGGLTRLVDALADQIHSAGGHIRCGSTVRGLERGPSGWRLTLGSTRDPEQLEVDGVVIAIPARPAARLLAATLGELGPWAELDYASLALITLAVPAAALPPLSGFLVPADTGFAVKAATFFTNKWSHLAVPAGTDIVRLSIGRYRDTEVLQRTDGDLVALAGKELADLLGTGVAPVAAVVNRWGGALPQYPPGHRDHVARVRDALPGTLALAGAAVDGVGIPACVASGQAAAARIVAHLAQSPA